MLTKSWLQPNFLGRCGICKVFVVGWNRTRMNIKLFIFGSQAAEVEPLATDVGEDREPRFGHFLQTWAKHPTLVPPAINSHWPHNHHDVMTTLTFSYIKSWSFAHQSLHFDGAGRVRNFKSKIAQKVNLSLISCNNSICRRKWRLLQPTFQDDLV